MRIEGPAESLFLSSEMHGKWLLHLKFHCKGRDNREVDGPVKVLCIMHALQHMHIKEEQGGGELHMGLHKNEY